MTTFVFPLNRLTMDFITMPANLRVWSESLEVEIITGLVGHDEEDTCSIKTESAKIVKIKVTVDGQIFPTRTMNVRPASFYSPFLGNMVFERLIIPVFVLGASTCSSVRCLRFVRMHLVSSGISPSLRTRFVTDKKDLVIEETKLLICYSFFPSPADRGKVQEMFDYLVEKSNGAKVVFIGIANFKHCLVDDFIILSSSMNKSRNIIVPPEKELVSVRFRKWISEIGK